MKNKIEYKEIILETALSLFYEKGYDATGVQEIVKLSGITKPTLYHYFGSKQGLLDTLLEQKNSILISALKIACKYEHDLYWTLTKIADSVFKFANENKKFYSMQLSMWFSSEKNIAHISVTPYLTEIHIMIEDLFKKASKDHEKLKGHEKLYTITFIGILNTYITVFQNNNIEFNEQVIHKAVKQFIHGIFAM